MLDSLTSNAFEPRVNEPFTAALGDTSVELTLSEVDVMDERSSRPGSRLAFSLIFHGPLEPLLPQGAYRLANEALGGLTLFMVPLGPMGNIQRYEVVFN